MQIVRTEVVPAHALTGEPVLRVLFCGVGGDYVRVDVTGDDGGSDKAALDRARAILVQTATFGMAANDYDAKSNGNFDEVDVTAANHENGAVYIFEYRDGWSGRQIPPPRMPSFEAARAEAVRCAVDLLSAYSREQTICRAGWSACGTRPRAALYH